LAFDIWNINDTLKNHLNVLKGKAHGYPLYTENSLSIHIPHNHLVFLPATKWNFYNFSEK